MSTQILASPSTKKISDIYSRVKASTYILQPEFQRKLVWNSTHKESFIETILKGLPFPEIYTAQSGVDIDKIEASEVVVDGQQRLSTIVEYIDEAPGSRIFGKKIKKYKDLTEDERRDFLNYNVVIRDLWDINWEVIREIFKRINQTKFSLQQVEIHNAVYDWDFISTAKNILEEIDREHLPIFSESEMSRMSNLHFILLVMTTIEVGWYFTRDTEIEKNIAVFDDEYPFKEVRAKELIDLLNFIKELNLPSDSIWYRKSNFFTLTIELYKASIAEPSKLRIKLLELEENVLKNKNNTDRDNDFSLYYANMYTGTNSRQARVVRSEIFKKYVII